MTEPPAGSPEEFISHLEGERREGVIWGPPQHPTRRFLMPLAFMLGMIFVTGLLAGLLAWLS
ncbi:hypothetical protein [Deinococcus arcticus]|nr:hypothetical protein [Deinococcus arcticus]